MVRRHAIRVVPATASWAFHIAALLAAAQLPQEEARGVPFMMRREEGGWVDVVALDGSAVGDVQRHIPAALALDGDAGGAPTQPPQKTTPPAPKATLAPKITGAPKDTDAVADSSTDTDADADVATDADAAADAATDADAPADASTNADAVADSVADTDAATDAATDADAAADMAADTDATTDAATDADAAADSAADTDAVAGAATTADAAAVVPSGAPADTEAAKEAAAPDRGAPPEQEQAVENETAEEVIRDMEEAIRDMEQADAMAQDMAREFAREAQDAEAGATWPGGTEITVVETVEFVPDDDDDNGTEDAVEISSGISALSHHIRDRTYYGRCPCNTGKKSVVFWANMPRTKHGAPPPTGRKFKVKAFEAPIFTFDVDVMELTIQCGGSKTVGRLNVSVPAGQPISVHLEVADNNSDHHFCGEQSAGFVTINSWASVPEAAGPIFVSGTHGYACFKSPQLLRLRDGSMLAFAQAVWPSCNETGHSTIVFRRSADEGASWSTMAQLVKIDESARERMGVCGEPMSMSNVVPIELDSGRVLALYMRNHYKTWLIRSDDGGRSWGGDHEIPTATPTKNAVQSPDCARTIDWFGAGPGPFTYAEELGKWLFGSCWYVDNNPYAMPGVGKRLSGEDWQWVGIGPGGGIQLNSGFHKGRILVPGYHSFIRTLDPHREAYNPTAHFWRNTAEEHTLVSDDGGETWSLSEGSIEESNTSRETNFFQLSNGAVYANSATLALGTPQFRTQAKVHADAPTGPDVTYEGLAFTDVPQPLGGCQGSVAADTDDSVYVSGPNGPVSETVTALESDIMRCKFNVTGRSGLTIWRSVDKGQTFSDSVVVDPKLSADSSIQVRDGKVWILYEQADEFPEYEMYGQRRRLGDMQIVDPDRIMFTTLRFPKATSTTTTPEQPTQAPIAAPTAVPPTPTAPSLGPHQLSFDSSDGFMDMAYYLSKADCESNENAQGWYISDDDAGAMRTAATDCTCHSGVAAGGSELPEFSVYACMYSHTSEWGEDRQLAFSFFAGNECTVDEVAQVNVFDSQDRFQEGLVRQGECVEATVSIHGDRSLPKAMYFRVEVEK